MKNIDLENHFLSKAFFNYLKDRTEYPRFEKGVGIIHREGAVFPAIDKPLFNPPHTIFEEVADIDARRLSIMDNCGVTNASVSSLDGMEDLPKDDCIRMAKATNDEIARRSRNIRTNFSVLSAFPALTLKSLLKKLTVRSTDLV